MTKNAGRMGGVKEVISVSDGMKELKTKRHVSTERLMFMNYVCTRNEGEDEKVVSNKNI